jgi:NTP pyrophosphatase (non-canonical NTP hydrolase)
MIYIIDGRKGSGKTTTVRALAKHFESQGLAVLEVKPSPPSPAESLAQSWMRVLRSTEGVDVAIIDRGLGTEWIYGRQRHFDPEYFYEIQKLDIEAKQNFSIIEVTLVCEDPFSRGREPWEGMDLDTTAEWLTWGSVHSSIIINTDQDPTEKVIEKITAIEIPDDLSGAPNLYDVIPLGYEDISLFELFMRQRKLMTLLDLQPGHTGIMSATLGLASEAGEVADLVNDFKAPWAGKLADNREHMLEELVDVIFYVVELFIMMGGTSTDLSDTYMAKWSRNIRRAMERRDDA